MSIMFRNAFNAVNTVFNNARTIMPIVGNTAYNISNTAMSMMPVVGNTVYNVANTVMNMVPVNVSGVFNSASMVSTAGATGTFIGNKVGMVYFPPVCAQATRMAVTMLMPQTPLRSQGVLNILPNLVCNASKRAVVEYCGYGAFTLGLPVGGAIGSILGKLVAEAAVRATISAANQVANKAITYYRDYQNRQGNLNFGNLPMQLAAPAAPVAQAPALSNRP